MTAVSLFSEKVVLGERPRQIVPATIDIAAGQITNVTPQPRQALKALPDVDLGTMLIAPAFINSHTHLPMVALRGIGGLSSLRGNVVEDLYFKIEQKLTAEDIRAFARMGAYECLLSGTGAVWDHYYCATAVAEAMAEVGLGGVLAPTLQDISGPGVIRLDKQLYETKELDDNWSSQGIYAALGPHATDTVSDALWTRVADLAETRNLPIHVHLAQSPDEFSRAQSRHGHPPLRHLIELGVLDAAPQSMLVHGLYVSNDEINALPQDRVALGYCPASQAQFDFPADVFAWESAGVKTALGTDAGACNDTIDIQAELRALAIGTGFGLTQSRHRQDFAQAPSQENLSALISHRRADHAARKSPDDVLDSVWTVPGRMHPKVRLGEITPGAGANLVVIDLDHPALWPATDPLHALVYNRCTSAIHGLMVGGKWIGQRGQFAQSLIQSTHYKESVTEATARLSALLKRANL